MIIGKLGRNLSRNLAGSWRYIRPPLEFRKIIWTNTIIFRFYISLRGCIVHQIHVKYMLCFFNLGIIGQKLTEKTSLKPRLLDQFFAKLLRAFFGTFMFDSEWCFFTKNVGCSVLFACDVWALFLLEKTYIQFISLNVKGGLVAIICPTFFC